MDIEGKGGGEKIPHSLSPGPENADFNFGPLLVRSAAHLEGREKKRKAGAEEEEGD
jgi:hypothetical protein